MVVTKTDISTNKPTTSQLIQVANGEDVIAETENANNLLMLQALILAYNWIIDSGVELASGNVYPGTQTFDTIKTLSVQSLTGTSDVLLTNGVFKYGGSAAGNEITTKDYVSTAIVNAGVINLNYAFGGIKTSNFTAQKGFVYLVDTTSGPITGLLPASPAEGDLVGFVDLAGKFNNNNFTIGRNSSEIMNLAEDMTVSDNYSRVYLMYETNNGWVLI